MIATRVNLMDCVLQVANRRSFPRRGVLLGLLAGLALVGLSGCSGSSEPALPPATSEPVASQPGEGDVDQNQGETTQTEPLAEEVDVFESLNFLGFAASSMRTEIGDLVPMEAYEIAGTGCQGKAFDYAVGEMDGGEIHFAVTPDGERIVSSAVGSAEGAVEAVWSACYASQGIDITSDQLVELVLNFGEVRFPEAENDSTMRGLGRASIDYEPPTYEQDGEDFTFSVLVQAREFGDIYRVHVERTGQDMTVEYEELHRG